MEVNLGTEQMLGIDATGLRSTVILGTMFVASIGEPTTVVEFTKAIPAAAPEVARKSLRVICRSESLLRLRMLVNRWVKLKKNEI